MEVLTLPMSLSKTLVDISLDEVGIFLLALLRMIKIKLVPALEKIRIKSHKNTHDADAVIKNMSKIYWSNNNNRGNLPVLRHCF